ncbi:hypothetical protein [Laceyella putida]|uniref:DUF3951 domain-containing protein n=1 Tax=Laceyella putida TaxID=110101 RepID=A0ABW2RK26_9BACL
MDKDFMVGIIVLGIVLIFAVTIVVLPKLKKKQKPHHYDPYINRNSQIGSDTSTSHLPSDAGGNSDI